MKENTKKSGGGNTVLYIILGIAGVFILMQLMKPAAPRKDDPPPIDPNTGLPMSTTAQDYQGLGFLFTGLGNAFSGVSDVIGSIFSNKKKTPNPDTNPYGLAPGTMAGGENSG